MWFCRRVGDLSCPHPRIFGGKNSTKFWYTFGMNDVLNRKIGRHRQRMLAPDWETHRLIQMSNAIKENRMFNFNTPSDVSIQEVILDITGRGIRKEKGIFVAPHLLVVNALAAELLKNPEFINDVYGLKKSYAQEIKLAVSQIICTGYLVYSKRHDLVSKYPEGVFICKEVRLKSFTEKYVTTDLGRKEVAEVLLRSEEMVDFFLGSQKVVSVGIMGEEIPNRNVSVARNELLVVHEKLDEMNKGIISVHELFSKYNQTVLDNVSESTNSILALKEEVSKAARPAPITKLVDVTKLKIQNSVLKLFPKIKLLDKNKTGRFVLEGAAKKDVVIGRVDTKNYKLVCNVLEYSGLEQNKSELYVILDTPLSKKIPEIQNFRGETRPFVHKKFVSTKHAIGNLNKLFEKHDASCRVSFAQKDDDRNIVILSLAKE